MLNSGLFVNNALQCCDLFLFVWTAISIFLMDDNGNDLLFNFICIISHNGCDIAHPVRPVSKTAIIGLLIMKLLLFLLIYRTNC